VLRIGITGANGFLGWHLRAHLHSRQDIQVTTADRATFADPKKLSTFVSGVDAIAHIAGVNRASEAELQVGNLQPAEQLSAACDSAGVRPHILYTNSTQHKGATPYALAKRAAGEHLGDWAGKRGARFTNLVLPHLFGECAKPFYNSAVATFCHQAAHAEASKIIVDSELELVHAQRVAAHILAAFETPPPNGNGELRIEGHRIMVSAVLAQIEQIARQYADFVIPPLASAFDLDLFNAYRSYLFPKHYPVKLALRADNRGELFEAVKSLHGGQCFLSTTRPGITRGNHYHHHKLERFLVVGGEATIRVRKLLTGETTEFHVSGREPAYVDMPALHTHNITNTGSGDLLTLFWSHEIFDPAAPDTFPEVV
jgi:UDP-2-acetamido-2,6-beta-L-arabino-hexul-4-ose reductase